MTKELNQKKELFLQEEQRSYSRPLAILSFMCTLMAHTILFISLPEFKKKPQEIYNMGSLKIRNIQTGLSSTQKKQQQRRQQKDQKRQEQKKKSKAKQDKFHKLAKKMSKMLKLDNFNAKNNQATKSAMISSSQNRMPTKAQKLAQGQPIPVQRFISKSDFFVDLKSARTQQDELNENEKVLYGFINRVILAYYNSLITNLMDYRQRHPYLNDFPFIKKDELIELRASARFDRNGNLIGIKMLKWTGVEHLQDYFIESLEKMEGLPNPPKMITEEDPSGEFVFIYGLNIDARNI